MGVRIYKGVYYGTYIKGDRWIEIDELIIDSGVLSDYECIDPHTPDEFYPFPNHNLIGMTYDGDGTARETRLFVGAKMDGEFELIRNRINEIEQQLDDFFSKVNGLEKKMGNIKHML